MHLAADIGGTKGNFALVDPGAETGRRDQTPRLIISVIRSTTRLL